MAPGRILNHLAAMIESKALAAFPAIDQPGKQAARVGAKGILPVFPVMIAAVMYDLDGLTKVEKASAFFPSDFNILNCSFRTFDRSPTGPWGSLHQISP